MPNPVLLRDTTDSERVNSLGDTIETFFYRLMMKSDDHGRHPNNPQLLKARLYPLQPDRRVTDISRYVALCVRAGLIRCYCAGNGRSYLEILKFGQKKQWMKAEHPPPDQPQGVLELPDSATGASPPPKKVSGANKSSSRGGVEESHGTTTGKSKSPEEQSPKQPPFKKQEKPEVDATPSSHSLSKSATGASHLQLWQLLRDEKTLTERIKKEAESTKPDKRLLEALKTRREKIREQMRTNQ